VKQATLAILILLSLRLVAFSVTLEADAWHVHPGENIQSALDSAANSTNKVVKVHAGLYTPNEKGQALIWFNRKHDGIQLQAVGHAILTAANRTLANSNSASAPAVVNHVIYFGQGISARTMLDGFEISGANHFVTTNGTTQLEPDSSVPKGLFFFCDGGAIKIAGRSFPTLRRLVVRDNYASPCAGGISIEHGGLAGDSDFVRIEDSVFQNNKSQVTGAAVDVLPGSAATISNCLFLSNAANGGVNFISPRSPATEFTNSAALTVFPGSHVIVRNSTFAENRNAVDDWGDKSQYLNCIFWHNELGGGFYTNERYDLELGGQATVAGCIFSGRQRDPRNLIGTTNNLLKAEAPDFDMNYKPRAPSYQRTGYSPADETFRPVIETIRSP